MKQQDNNTRDRFLSPDEVRKLQDRVRSMQKGGGDTLILINSSWAGNVRWGRNRVVSTGDIESSRVSIGRKITFSLPAFISTNGLDDDSLRAAIRRAEGIHEFYTPNPDNYVDRPERYYPYAEPDIWHDSSYNLNAESRAEVVADIINKAQKDGLTCAGYVAVGATARSVSNSADLLRYYPYTTSELTITVRDPKRGGSGWAGVDWDDWDKIDVNKLYAIASDKCLKSINPVAIEPGRYTAILEPQAVCSLTAPLVERFDRRVAELDGTVLNLRKGLSKLSLKILDERLTISADPMDPGIGFPPFDWSGHSYQNVNWVENGVLTNLSYDSKYAVTFLGHDKSLPNSLAFRMSGGNTSIEEMIETTSRGILVTRFSNTRIVDPNSLLLSAFTRDGLWLIENGKISKSVKNFRIVDSPMFVLNNIVQLGIPERVYRPEAPAICPALKVNDFSFAGLVDAV